MGGNSTSSDHRNNTNTDGIYTQTPRSNNSTTSTHSSTNGGTNNQHPTFDNYRFGGFAEIINRLGSSNSTSTTNDDEISCEIGEVLSPPPPAYNTALEGAGLPPPYMNDQSIEVTIHNSESPQMSERYVPPRRPVPSVPSSSSLRRPVPQVPQQQQQQSSTQSTQYTSQDPSIISDSSSRRPVPSIPQSSGRPVRPVPSVPTSPSTNSITK